MPDQPYPAGIKPPVNTDSCGGAKSGFVRTDPYCQTIKTGPVDEDAQDYRSPEFTD